MNRYIFLPCCTLLFALAIPQQSSRAQEGWAAKVAKDFWESMIHSARKDVTALDKKIAEATVEKVPQETLRPLKAREVHLKERLRRLPESPTTEDIASFAWEMADQETQARVKAEVARLEAQLDVEAKQIGEEERLAEKCEAGLASVFQKTACYCLKTKTETDHWPDGEKLTQVVEGYLGKAEIECLTSRLLPRRVAETVEPWVKSFLGGMMRDSGQKPGSSSEMKKAVSYQLVHCACGGK